MNNASVGGQAGVSTAGLLGSGSPIVTDARYANRMQQVQAGTSYTAYIPPGESVLEEAHRLTHGPRQQDYGHPLDDYTRAAALVSAMLAHKLKEPLTAHEMALAMVCVKLSRQVNRPKRDNMVDGAGYCWVADEILEETARRAGANRVR